MATTPSLSTSKRPLVIEEDIEINKLHLNKLW